MKIVLAGGTGFIGRKLLPALLAEKHQVTLLTRNAKKAGLANTLLRVVYWDPSKEDWKKEIDGADAVINLAGESIADKRWTSARKEALAKSRLESTRAIVGAMASASKKPQVFVNASAVGYYGSVPEGNVDENHPAGNDFLAGLCREWELEASNAQALGIRTVLLRTGIVLEKDGGALKKMILPFKIFAGGPLGSGRQWFPWIHRDDVVGAILFALKNPALQGPVNLAAPESVTTKDFCSALGRALGRPSWAPVPAFVLKIALGEMSGMLLTGQKAVPSALQKSGYSFLHPRLDEALRSIVK